MKPPAGSSQMEEGTRGSLTPATTGRKGWPGCPRGFLKGGYPTSSHSERCAAASSQLENSEKNSVWMEEEEVKRPESWKYWEEDAISQRPGPLELARVPELEFADMTANCIDGEGGGHVNSPEKDNYRRTEAQLRNVSAAQEDQRNVAGGTYKCVDSENKDFFLSIRKGYKSKVIGIVMEKLKEGEAKKVVFESFGSMRYEYFRFGQSGRRFRQTWPEETLTGFIWEGYGGDALPLPSSDVHVYAERVDRDVHFPGEHCNRVTEAPGASQMLCSSQDCGLVTWHLSRKCFRKGKGQEFFEKWQEDFALVTFKNGKQQLIWTHPHRKLKRSRWERLENSSQFNAYVINEASRQRVESVVSRKCLPRYTFPTPSYVPTNQGWRESEPLTRQKKGSKW